MFARNLVLTFWKFKLEQGKKIEKIFTILSDVIFAIVELREIRNICEEVFVQRFLKYFNEKV